MNFHIPHFSDHTINSDAKNAIVVVGIRPNKFIINNLVELTRYYKNSAVPYDVFYIPDDDGQPFIHPELNILQVSKMECSQQGFQHMIMFHHTVPNNAHVCGWDKALYIASKLKKYDHYWLIEDDVFYSHLDLFSEVDSKTFDFDLLCKEFFPTLLRTPPFPAELLKDNWEIDPADSVPKRINPLNGFRESVVTHALSKFKKGDYLGAIKSYQENCALESFAPESSWLVPPPHIHSLSSVLRISHKLLRTIADFAATHATLFIQEYIFTTLAYHNNLKVGHQHFNGRDGALQEMQKHYNKFTNHEYLEDSVGYKVFQIDYMRNDFNNVAADKTLSGAEKCNILVNGIEGQSFPFLSKFFRPNPEARVLFHPFKDVSLFQQVRKVLHKQLALS